MIIAAIIIYILSGSFLFIASCAFLRAKDVFVMNQILKITNFYIIPLILIALELEKFSLISLIKIIAIIILNFIATLLITHLIAKKAVNNKIIPDTTL
jgi:multisubunit Na+/H+ antiporter MnhG subunit